MSRKAKLFCILPLLTLAAACESPTSPTSQNAVVHATGTRTAPPVAEDGTGTPTSVEKK